MLPLSTLNYNGADGSVMLPVTSQDVIMSQEAYFQYEIHTFVFAAFEFVFVSCTVADLGEGFMGSIRTTPPLSSQNNYADWLE